MARSLLLKLLLWTLCLLHLMSCATTSKPEEHFRAAIVSGERFLHQVYDNTDAEGEVLHVYLEGDGRPWRTRYQVSLDPSPERLITTELMLLDSAPSVYIGRPCYHLSDPNCSPLWWTHRRYAPAVVESLNAVIERYAASYEGIVLIGHSGGGTLAMLLALKRSDVVGLVTLAGNLDVAGWTHYHSFTPLTGSLDPATQPPLDHRIAQFHYLGLSDRKITPDMARAALSAQSDANLILLEGVDHSCCWASIWPRVLQELRLELDASIDR